MKKLEIPNGGMPFTGDDLLWMQNGLTEAVEAIIETLVTPKGHVVLSGCELTIDSSNIVISEGWLVINRKPCYCPELTIPGTNISSHELYINDLYDPQGNDVFADSVSRDTYLAPVVAFRDATQIGSEDRMLLSDLEESRIDLRPELSEVTIVDDDSATILTLRQGRMVTINGTLDGTQSTTGGIIATTPFKPKNNVFIPLLNNVGVRTNNRILVTTSGQIRLFGEALGSESAVFQATYYV